MIGSQLARGNLGRRRVICCARGPIKERVSSKRQNDHQPRLSDKLRVGLRHSRSPRSHKNATKNFRKSIDALSRFLSINGIPHPNHSLRH